MPRQASPAALALAALALALPAAASDGCSTASTGAGCVAVPGLPSRPAAAGAAESLSSASLATPGVEVGSVLERGRYSILLNAGYYGLPAVSDGWVYMRVGRDLYRVDWATHAVLERVTERAAANF